MQDSRMASFSTKLGRGIGVTCVEREALWRIPFDELRRDRAQLPSGLDCPARCTASRSSIRQLTYVGSHFLDATLGRCGTHIHDT
jgi:hypothetical protein